MCFVIPNPDSQSVWTGMFFKDLFARWNTYTSVANNFKFPIQVSIEHFSFLWDESKNNAFTLILALQSW